METENKNPAEAHSDAPENITPVSKKPAKWIIAAFAVMGAVIVGLIIALIITNTARPSAPAGEAVPFTEDSSVAEEIVENREDVIESSQPANTEKSPADEQSPQVDEQSPQVNEQIPQSEPADAASTEGGVAAVPEESSGADDAVENPEDVKETAPSQTPETSSVNEQPAQTEPIEVLPAENGILLEYSVDNSWESGGATMYGIQFGITNKTGSGISGWELVMEIEGLSSCDGWNGSYIVSDSTLTITNAEYNGDISTGGNVVIGCNLGTTLPFSVKSARLNGIDCMVKKGHVTQNSQNNNGSQQGDNGNENTTVDVSALLERSKQAVQGDDWLYTDGNGIVDKNGKRVWLTGVNWFGYNTGTNTFDGLWNSKLKPSVEAIADHGFNLIRVPISAELINQWASGEYPKANYNNAYNTELNSMNSLEIFDYFLKLAEENGIKVMPDIHSAESNASGHNVNLWYTSKVSAEEFYSALEWMADRYKDNDTIIAYDLKNEPHGKPYEGSGAAIWNDSSKENNWKYTAETAAARILAKNPNVLIMIEGTEIYPTDIASNSDYHSTDDDDYYFNWWGGNLRGVKDYPIDLGKYQNKLVYSPHDYGPAVYAQPWFEGGYSFDSLMKDCWRDNWFYIHENNTAPLLIGEWGGFMKEPNLSWMTYMRRLIKENKLNHTFWCFNANSGDTGGLVLDDFQTWDEEKYAFVKEVLWQEGGMFVGLDHAIPLGKNGISLSSAKGI